MATRIAHIWWLPHPQTPSKAATKRVQFLPTLYMVQDSEQSANFSVQTNLHIG